MNPVISLAAALILSATGLAADFPDSPETVRVAAANSSAADKAVADLVCSGTNDERVLNAAIERLKKGGTVRLADGDYRIDAFEQEGGSAVLFGYNGGSARTINVIGGTENKSYNTRHGVTIHVTEKAVKAMDPKGVYRVFYGTPRRPKSRGDFFTMTHVNNVNFKNFYLYVHDASKPWRGIDGSNFGNMHLVQVGIYTERYFEDRFMHLKPATPVRGSVGVVSVPSSNDEMSRAAYDYVNVGGMHTGFLFQGVDHLILSTCSAARCCYGYRFEQRAAKTLTFLNCCDEGNTHLPYFGGQGHLTAIDFNIERFNAAYIPDSPDKTGPEAAEQKPGSWHGFVSYTMQGKAFGLEKFWKNGSGINFRTVNLNHDHTSRPAHPEYLETYFDKKTRKTLTWDGTDWVDALGKPVADEQKDVPTLGRWDTNALFRTPKVTRVPSMDGDGVKAVMIDALPWQGKSTQAFAYYAVPDGASAEKPAPGVVLVHGGLSTASKRWVKIWKDRGYAAVAMDTCGGWPVKGANGAWLRHDRSGPPGWGRFATVGEPIRDQWFYHAVADIVLSHSFLRAQPGVAADRIGLVGGSWGGVLSCVAASVDPRFRFAVPVFGCGFLGDHSFVSWRLGMQGATAEQGDRWLKLWDPSLFLPQAKCPFLWLDGTNDFHFQLDCVAKSAALVKDSAFTTIVKLLHGDGPCETRPEIFAFADRHVRGGRDVVRFSCCRVQDGVLSADVDAAGRAIAKMRLVWTTSSDADWTKRPFEERVLADFDAKAGRVSAKLPEGTTIAFVAADTDDGLVSCTPPQIDPLRPYDIVIYGGTSAGIAAAVQAKRMGAKALVIEPGYRIGGLTTGGLGQTDIGRKEAYGGIALDFYKDVRRWYSDPAHWKHEKAPAYAADGQCKGSEDAKAMWTFEPSAALAILEGWERRDGLEIVRGERLDRGPGGVTVEKGRITAIRMESGRVCRAACFIDATYEGDLMAAAGVKYAVGRESNATYGEKYNGIQVAQAKYHQFFSGVDPYVVKGDPASGLLPGVEPYDPAEKDGDGDRRVQAYCFRMCLTDVPENRIPFAKPEGYDEREFELLFRDFEQRAAHPEEVKGYLVGLCWINSRMPCRKTDTNNRHGFSTDFIGGNWNWPEASYAEREEIFARHLQRQKGLMWTLANHPRVPEYVRKEVSRWGTCRDEFLDRSSPGDGWQGQLYVREARRMVGDYVMTEHDCSHKRTVPKPVAKGSYNFDSHHVRRRVGADGFVHNEGDVEVSTGGGAYATYGIAYGAIVPKRTECRNLIVPTCLSASHIAFGSIRMEPVFFALGQAAGTAAAIAVRDGVDVQSVDYQKLSARLESDGQVFR